MKGHNILGDGEYSKTQSLTTLSDYLQRKEIDPELVDLVLACSTACTKISNQLSKLPLSNHHHHHEQQRIRESDMIIVDDKKLNSSMNLKSSITTTINIQGEEQKPMDVIANDIFKSHVMDYAAAIASEEEEDIIHGRRQGRKFEIAFDPLDGSSNLDVNVPTGTIFGISPFTCMDKAFTTSGRSLVVAGYAVYSSATELVVSLNSTTTTTTTTGSSLCAAGFTLDIDSKEFILTRPNLQCPPKGGYYSLNDGREPDWPQGLSNWIYDAKRGNTPSGTIYSSRYICSLCADVHRTLIKGGWAGNPRPHLRLLYEAAPLAHITEACLGRASDGKMDLLDIVPTSLHQRTSVFMGSKCDIDELESYGDIQQLAKVYKQ